MDKKPTIDDVAKMAGVARATVSRVLNSSPNTSKRARERVIQAVSALNYQVNQQARQLASGASRILALVFAADAEAEPNSYYHSAVELGAIRACNEQGYGLVTHTLDPAKQSYRSSILALADDGRSDGLVLTPPFCDDHELIQALQSKGFPFVLVSAGPDARHLSCSVGIDDRQAGLELGVYLLLQGHRRFGFITGPLDHKSAALRLEGFLEALDNAGHSDQIIEVADGNFTFKSGIDQAEGLLSRNDRPTALVCANDDMAAGALFTAHRLGLIVPADLSITGFDDTPVSQIVWPPLTTIHQPLRLIGSKAVELLIADVMRENGSTTRVAEAHLVSFQLVERGSTSKISVPPSLEALPISG
ncbi:LacI family DNA-binding transcriptional regulator [Allopontixanthobacter sp.]|uniref:LacI family DNA-binding transcriptional regulator n=1 Tax=Allopontixanthobacter sp. TaxID=2906452 RepID=UPI002ABC8D29|nr:LacI family DNA-binding transcriptional regulator [Allopontixanthobacter sp.]MDZ4307839.1 LacI family DNA-binding transcriptional regulator [Allopontixanthobacter sp.]